MLNKIKTSVILIRKQPYKESSVLMQVFSDTLGMITVLAKGMHKNKRGQEFLLNVLNEYEMVITDVPSGGIHVLTELSLIDEYPTDLPLNTWFAAQAGLEILTVLMIPTDETPAFYNLLKQYLTYQKAVHFNPIAILWRYQLHLNKLLGIPIALTKCASCQGNMKEPGGYTSDTGQLVCTKCMSSIRPNQMLSPEAGLIISLLPQIGNHLEDLHISKETIVQINLYFLSYLRLHFHKNIQLKSLQFFEQQEILKDQ